MSLLRLAAMALAFVPYGMLAAAVAPHREMPYVQWVLLGGFLSWAAIAIGVLCLFAMPSGRANERVYCRPCPGGGTIMALLGALLVTVVITSVGKAIVPWAQSVLCAAVVTTVGVFLAELLAWSCVELRDTGFVVSTIFTRRYVLYGEVRSGIAHDDGCPRIALVSGDHLQLPGAVVRRRNGDSLGRRLFASYLPQRGTAACVRFIDCSSRRAVPVPQDPDTAFFTTCLGEKSSLGWHTRIWAAVGLGLLFLMLAGALNGFEALWPLSLLPQPVSALVAPQLAAAAPYLAFMLFCLLVRFIVRERQRGRLLRFAERCALGSESASSGEQMALPWEQRALRRLWLYIAACAVALTLIFCCSRQIREGVSEPGRVLLATIAGGAVLVLFVQSLRFYRREGRAAAALLDDAPGRALEVLAAGVPDDSRSPWQCYKAYALSLLDRDPGRALELARRDMLRLAAPVTFITSSVAAARVLLRAGNPTAAAAIAKKTLLRFPWALAGAGLFSHAANEARRILEETQSTD